MLSSLSFRIKTIHTNDISKIYLYTDGKELGCFERFIHSDYWRLQIKYQSNNLDYYYIIYNTNNTEIKTKEKRVNITKQEIIIDDGIINKINHQININKHLYQLRIIFGENSIVNRSSCIHINSSSIYFNDSITSISLSNIKNKEIYNILYPLNNPLDEYIFYASNEDDFTIMIEYKDIKDKILGYSIVPNFITTEGKLKLPIIDNKFNCMGYIIIEYLMVIPFHHSFFDTKDYNISGRIFLKHQKHLRIGHRGSGANGAISNEGNYPISQENTLLAFHNAYKNGYNYIEFDVNLSKDCIPVIYHDSSLPIRVKEHNFRIPINSISIDEFNIMSQVNKESKEIKGISYDKYPTLEQLFEELPTDLGFDIEIKYLSYEESLMHYIPKFTRNETIDAILKIVFNAAEINDRPIFFSSFDIQCCILLQEKQSKYPVFLLTEAGDVIYPSDPRKNTMDDGIQFCESANLFGIIAPSSVYLNNKTQVEQTIKSGLIPLTWGHTNNDPINVQKQENMNIHGIISDHII